MDLDDLTLHKFRALKECPQGQLPGTIFETTNAQGEVLINVGLAERVTEPDAATDEARDADVKTRPAKGKYARRDLRAEDQ